VLVDESSYVLKDAILEVHDLALSASGYENYHEVGGEGWLVIDVLPDHGVPAGLTLQHSALESVRKPLFQMRNK